MTDSKPKSIRFDRENYQFLTNHDNASALVRDLVEQYRTEGQPERAALKLRRKQKADELDEAREKVERLENDLAEIDAMVEDMEAADDTNIDEAAEALEGVELTRDNPAVQNWSQKLGVTSTQLIDSVEKHRNSTT